MDADAIARLTIGLGAETRDASTQSVLHSCLTCENCLLVPKLLAAARAGDEPAIDAVLAQGDCLNELHRGWAPLHWLACVGYAHGARLLLRRGADVGLRAARRLQPLGKRVGETALHLAARAGHRQTCAVLIAAGAPLAQYDDTGLLPLHVAALCEVLASDADFEGSVAEQLLHAGADPWALTFNRDLKKPWELAHADWQRRSDPCAFFGDAGARNGDFQGSEAYSPGSGAPLRPSMSPTEAHVHPEMSTDSLQSNNKMHLFLKAMVTPGTVPFCKAQTAESERLGLPPGRHVKFSKENADRENRGEYEVTGIAAVSESEASRMQAHEWFSPSIATLKRVEKTPTAFDFGDRSIATELQEWKEEVKFLHSVEAAAVRSRGLAEDLARMQLYIPKIESRVWDLEERLREAEQDLREAESTVEELQLENAALRAELHTVARAARDEDDSISESDSSKGSGDCGVTRETAGPGASSKRKARDRKADQTRRARELVRSGAVLTRNKIDGLNKAEARAYLSSMKATVRGNADELKIRLRQIFDANGIDAFKLGDALVMTDPVPAARSTVLQIATLPSVEALDAIDQKCQPTHHSTAPLFKPWGSR